MQAIMHGVHPTTNVPQQIKTDGNGNLNITVSFSGVTSRALGDNADAVAASATAQNQTILSRNTVFNGTTWDRQRGDTFGVYQINVGSSGASAAITPVVGQNVFSIVGKASAGNLYQASMIAGATAGFMILYNATAAPANGAALTAALVLDAVPVAANAQASIQNNIGERYSTGIVVLFSTALATFTQPANAAVFMKARVS